MITIEYEQEQKEIIYDIIRAHNEFAHATNIPEPNDLNALNRKIKSGQNEFTLIELYMTLQLLRCVKSDKDIKKLQNKIQNQISTIKVKEIKKTYWGNETDPILEIENINQRIKQTEDYIKSKLGNKIVSFTTKQRKKFECPFCGHDYANIIELISNETETKHILRMNCTDCFCNEEYLLYLEE